MVIYFIYTGVLEFWQETHLNPTKEVRSCFLLICPVLISAITGSKWWSYKRCLGIWIPIRNWKACVMLGCMSLRAWSSSTETDAQSSCFSDQISGLAFSSSLHWAVMMWKLWRACSWLCQPRPCSIATDFHLHILSWRTLGFVSPMGCVPGLKHCTISRVSLSYCFAVWSGFRNHTSELNTTNGDNFLPRQTRDSSVIKAVFILLPGYYDMGLPEKFVQWI